MLAALTLHLLAAATAPALVRWLDRRAFLVLALAPAASFAWFVAQAPRVTGSGTVTTTYAWVPALHLELAFALSTLTLVMALLVTGVGALVLFYCAFYFREGDPDVWRFSAVLTAFAGSMLGLVVANDLLLMYVFWELTTVFSYLLIGHNPERRANRRAAMNALIVTTLGGLAMLVGIVVLGRQTGTYRIDELLAASPTGTAVTVAVGLVLLGAVSKSALVPFHFWLPGAMAAPTPVSAYLHAAAMVKAGIYLVALLAPAFADTLLWRPGLLALGVVTMVVGGLRALRQYDVKLLLAYGTVSQLGFLMVLVGAGTRAAALAGLALVVGHAFFKAALFMVVGVVDHSAHTRDLRRLSGLRPRMPVLFALTLVASASMAGLPPLVGFVAKEAALGAFLSVARTGVAGDWFGWVVLAGLVLGSLLTVAYTARFVWGVFGDKPGVQAPADLVPVPPGFAAPAGVLAAGSLALGFLGHPMTVLLSPYAEQFPAGPDDLPLGLWHGPSVPLLLTAIAVVGGLGVFGQWRRIAALRPALPALDAERAYHACMRGVDRLAVEVTARTQRGSLPIYLGVILVVVVVIPGAALVMNRDWGPVVAYDNPAQAVVAVLMAAAAVMTVRSRRRLRAVLLVSVSGYGTAMLFLLHGAPDLALTQVLVETVTLVIFVLVLRRMSPYFSNRPLNASRWWRVTLGTLVGATIAGVALAASGTRVDEPVSVHFAKGAVEYGGGRNIVNVTLVDIRAWDTMGELSVLVVAATGVASLIFLITGRTGRPGPNRDDRAHGASSWLRASRTLPAERRSVLFEIVTRLIFHTMIVFSVYLIFSGHNAPGGGFAAGLMTGLALMVRYLAGGRHELDDAAPVDAGVVLGLGLATATVAGLAPMAFGGDVLQSAIADVHLPVLGHVHLVTSLFFDLGVYLVVVGLMLDVLRSLGGGIDRQGQVAGDAR
ncbi:MAG: Na+/H+ antiporter subunit A [Nocardioidaceae bacterium]